MNGLRGLMRVVLGRMEGVLSVGRQRAGFVAVVLSLAAACLTVWLIGPNPGSVGGEALKILPLHAGGMRDGWTVGILLMGLVYLLWDDLQSRAVRRR